MATRETLLSFLSRAELDGACFDPVDVQALRVSTVLEFKRRGFDMRNVEPWLDFSCLVGEGYYPHHPMDLKVLITMTNMILTYIDDLLQSDPSALLEILPNLLVGQPQADRQLEFLVKEILPHVRDHYDLLAANAIIGSIHQFFIGVAMEDLNKTVSLSTAAPGYPEFLRLKTGAPEAFAHFIFPSQQHPDPRVYLQAMPDLCAIVNRINDVLSFYKEELQGDVNSFVRMRSKASGIDVVSALRLACDETIQCIDNVASLLSGHSDALSAFRDFVTGYIRFHTSSARYRLKELLADDL